jgi:hypothetical protein
MNPKLLELATRHGALKARIDEQRRTLARQLVPLEAALAKGDMVFCGVDWLRHHLAVVGIVVAVVVAMWSKRAWRWAKRSFFLWRGWQAVRNSLSGAR